MAMSSNMSCPHGNSTLGCTGDPASSSVGLSVGLTFLCLLLAAGMAALLYTQRRRLRGLLTSSGPDPERPRTPEETGYRGLATAPTPADHCPIYQNFTASERRHTDLDMSRSLGEREEDLYLQCDPLDEAIYCNEPSCNLTLLPPDTPDEEEDLYIVPKAM